LHTGVLPQAQGVPQLGHIHVEVAGVEKAVVAPELVKDVLAGDVGVDGGGFPNTMKTLKFL
jgi:hypothetical protein